MKREKIGIIGAGNMASALVKGMLTSEENKPEDIVCISKHHESERMLAKATGIETAKNLEEFAEKVDVIILACKPKDLEGLAGELAPLVKDHLLVSMLAGVTLAELAKFFSSARGIIRIMPNILAEVGASITTFCFEKEPKAVDQKPFRRIVMPSGTALQVKEEQMDSFTILFGSGPGIFMEFLDSYIKAAKKLGLDPEMALPALDHLVLGTGMLLAQSGKTLEQLRDSVTSAGGCTEVALKKMRERGLQDIMEETMISALERLQK
ncbi:MAG: pyrroline-5-carboxylate reductase [Verrucomicrobia bacterium CG_4_10_14_3_um_filter_43_23]|nr:MAG: pyrroline-5-carboxylate reductase [Verrucomicrobia bacterium CG1_02_43_26]PIP60129.1 MAG: pyrroline-5-carboxylate reductase [Verrucomicrobia bacterium CG22_combo_CG10-13_8_21_14_all_43_17]PIX58765.1 MAG: pyrroline-5-carboxylate reductase [Verrucomicrobia bacterium CG_4_10_14_3_um_filter_43_23]PIY62256.1 MAG: pyrroline-5-carboxylate reductase [Verrucomicrobia bacterium CG_4_10_14_0_8_um_filter_43_34]PJA43991.1 MAG: pyrroline-5-carboxylate reductase [Verrucomicrobia bacterium CG_4_9_14_3_